MPKNNEKMKFIHLLYISANNILIPVISLMQIVLIVRISGVKLWTVLAIGIALGGIAQALIDRGYANSGSGLLLKQKNLYFLATDSIRHRFPVFVAFILGGLLPFVIIEPVNYDLIYLSYFSLCISGLSVDWVLISGGRFIHLFLISAVPRLVASVIGLSAYVFTQNILVILISSIIGAALNVLLGVRSLNSMKRPLENRSRNLLGKQDYMLRVTNDIVWLMPIPLVNYYSPLIAPLFTFSDRLIKFPLLVFLQSLTQFLTNSILSSREEFRRKIHQSLMIHCIIGIFFSIGTLLFLPRIVGLISDNELSINLFDSFLLGIFAFFLFITRPLTQHYFMLTNQKKLIVKVNSVFILISFLLYSSGILVYSQLLFVQAILQGLAFVLYFCIYLRQEIFGKILILD
jgi:hypothetical protein